MTRTASHSPCWAGKGRPSQQSWALRGVEDPELQPYSCTHEVAQHGEKKECRLNTHLPTYKFVANIAPPSLSFPICKPKVTTVPSPQRLTDQLGKYECLAQSGAHTQRSGMGIPALTVFLFSPFLRQERCPLTTLQLCQFCSVLSEAPLLVQHIKDCFFLKNRPLRHYYIPQ